MRIRWTPAAAADLEHNSNYLKDHHPTTGSDHAQALRGNPFPEKDSPTRSHLGREDGTRELFVPTPVKSFNNMTKMVSVGSFQNVNERASGFPPVRSV
jgi:hypothetical protein